MDFTITIVSFLCFTGLVLFVVSVILLGFAVMKPAQAISGGHTTQPIISSAATEMLQFGVASFVTFVLGGVLVIAGVVIKSRGARGTRHADVARSNRR